MNNVGFGLASAKQEGYILNYDSDITCDGFSRDFDVYFNSRYRFTWYNKPFRNVMRSISKKAWNAALITAETRRRIVDAENLKSAPETFKAEYECKFVEKND